MKIGRQIAEKILSHCSKCGGCPVAKLMDAQSEGKGSTQGKKTLGQKSKGQSSLPTCPRVKNEGDGNQGYLFS